MFYNYIIKRENKNIEKILKQQNTIEYKTSILEKSMWGSYIYIPEGEIKGYIIDIYGSGKLVAGSPAQNRPFCCWLAEQGYQVFCLDYPLIPYVNFIEQLDFILEAIEKIIEVTPDWDNKPKYLFGDSAGALLALFTLGLTSPIYRIKRDFGVIHNNVEVQWSGVWFQSPIFYTAEPTLIDQITSRFYYGKKWKKQAYAKYIKNPIQNLFMVIPHNTIFSSGFGDELHYHFKRAWYEMEDITGNLPIALKSIYDGHNMIVLFPFERLHREVKFNALFYLDRDRIR